MSASAVAPRLPRRLRQARFGIAALAVAAVAVAVKSFVIGPLTGHFEGTFEDFAAYLGAARSMAGGGSAYAAFSSVPVTETGFVYPPFAALLVRPLALLSTRTAMVVWLWLTLACAVTGAIVVARTALPKSWPRVELAILGAVAFAPATYNYWHGQINPAIFLLLAISYWAYVHDRQMTAGVLLGLAAGIKIAPVIFLIVLIRRRWWRGTAAMVSTGVVTLILGTLAVGGGAAITFVTKVLPGLNRATGWIYNQSLGGAISRVAHQSVLVVQTTSWPVQVANLVAALLVLGLAAWAIRPEWRCREERGAEFGLAITAMLLAGGIAWYPHFVHLIIPLFCVLGLVAARGWRAERSTALAAVGVLIGFGLVAPLAISDLSMSGIVAISRTPAWWPFLQLCSLPCASVVWLAVALARSLRRNAEPAGSPARDDARAVGTTA